MVDVFREGAESVGHRGDVVDVCRKKIAGCLVCEYCHTKGDGVSVQKDDMRLFCRLSEKTPESEKSGYDIKLQ